MATLLKAVYFNPEAQWKLSMVLCIRLNYFWIFISHALRHCIIILFFVTGFLTDLSGQQWQTLKPENACTNRHENALALVGNNLILLGGRGVKPVESFDLKTNRWTKLAETPLEMNHFQAITYKGEVWVLGAFSGAYPHEIPVPDMYIFNPGKNEWRKGPSIPEGRRRGAAGAFVYKDKIYFVDGEVDGHWDGTQGWFDEFDPATGAWKELPDAPHARDHVSASVVDDRLYLAGGRKSSAKTGEVINTTVSAVDIYDFKTGTWTSLGQSGNIPTPRAGASSVVSGKRLLIIGGESGAQEASHNNVEALNTKTMKWEILSPLNQGRHGTGAVQSGGKIYTIAGSGNRGGGPELNTIEVYYK